MKKQSLIFHLDDDKDPSRRKTLQNCNVIIGNMQSTSMMEGYFDLFSNAYFPPCFPFLSHVHASDSW